MSDPDPDIDVFNFLQIILLEEGFRNGNGTVDASRDDRFSARHTSINFIHGSINELNDVSLGPGLRFNKLPSLCSFDIATSIK